MFLGTLAHEVHTPTQVGYSMSGLRKFWCLLAGLLFVVLPSAAQLKVGNNVKLNLSGDISVGYDGTFSNEGQSSHGMGLGGDGVLSGYYYNPNFVSFTSRPYYDRAQSNSVYQSIGDNSGIDNTVNIFNGSHFPGSISYTKNYNSIGEYGIPGTSGLITHGNGTSYGITWGALLDGLPSLTASYLKSTSSSSIYGDGGQNDSSSRNITLSSGYTLKGFHLNGVYMNMSNDTTVPSFLQGFTTNTHGTNNAYLFNASHSFPMHGSFSAGFDRDSYSYHYQVPGDSSQDTASTGTADSINSILAIHPTPKLSAVFQANYTDNLSGTIAEQIINAGGEAPQTNVGPLRTLLFGGSAGYELPKNISLGAGVSRQEEYFEGQSYGTTQFNANVNYNYARPLFGALYLSIGVVDTASQLGNTGTAIVGNVSFARKIHNFDVGANFNYSQNVQTLYILTVGSAYNYGATVRRKLPGHTFWNASVGGGHSGFVTTAGTDSHQERVGTSLSRRGYGINANYSQSYGASLLTATGLIGIPGGLPPGVVSNYVVFNARSLGVGASVTLLGKMIVTGSYSDAKGSTLSYQLNVKNSSQVISGLLRYPYRKVYISAGFTQFNQGLLTPGSAPSVVSSYYFGISRWFNVF